MRSDRLLDQLPRVPPHGPFPTPRILQIIERRCFKSYKKYKDAVSNPTNARKTLLPPTLTISPNRPISDLTFTLSNSLLEQFPRVPPHGPLHQPSRSRMHALMIYEFGFNHDTITLVFLTKIVL